MTWEWSHTGEAYAAVDANIHDQPREWLTVVFAEWQAYASVPQHNTPGSSASDAPDDDGVNRDPFTNGVYEKALELANTLPDDVLADDISEKTSEQALCTNGGWQAHCCPYGCGCHMVPFDHGEEDEAASG